MIRYLVTDNVLRKLLKGSNHPIIFGLIMYEPTSATKLMKTYEAMLDSLVICVPIFYRSSLRGGAEE